ncbi:MAG: hypothetical protein JXO72_05705 [Vicinamibacteria bacterium]|nr:hypothetical protein [Vicinamibacteria bacterium]
MPAISPETRHAGNKVAGFRITYTPGEGSIHFECWGYWTSDVAAAFSQHAIAACQEVGTPIDFMLDATALKPQGEWGQEAFCDLLSGLASLKLSSARVSASNVLTRIQLTRLARECGVDSLLHFDSHQANASPIVDKT